MPISKVWAMNEGAAPRVIGTFRMLPSDEPEAYAVNLWISTDWSSCKQETRWVEHCE